MAAIKPGTKASFDVWRDGKKQTVAIEVGELKQEQPVARAQPEGKGKASDTGKLGLAVAIIALLFFNYLQTRVGLIASAYARSCERFVQALLYLESAGGRESSASGGEVAHAFVPAR